LLSRIDILGPGRPEEVPDRYRSASVTVLPAENEAFGLVLVESLACGTPVVCTPAGGMPEILGDSGVGRVARSFEPEDIAVAIRECLELAGDPATAHRCVERAYKWAWESAVGPAHEKIYQKIVRPSHTRLVHR
jgi:glycosyltransferase involved in cell wall biosynthesis